MDNIFLQIKQSCENNKEKESIVIKKDSGICCSYTFSQVLENAENFRQRLEDASMQPGDRIGLISENSPEWVFAFLAIISSNCTSVLIDPALPAFEITEFIEKSDLRGIMMSPNVRAKLGNSIVIPIPTFDIKNNAKVFPGDKSHISGIYPKTPDIEKDVVAILYSSGTTSTSKGVMQTHEGLRIMAMKNLENYLLTDKDKLLAVVPLYHIYGFMANVILPLLCGASICFLETINSENIRKTFLEYKPTGISCVPRIYSMFGNSIMDTAKSKGKLFLLTFNFLFFICYYLRKATGIAIGKQIFKSVHEIFGGNIRGFISGGSILEKSTYNLFYGLGFTLLNCYGITETNVPITTNNFFKFSNSCGPVVSDVNIRISKIEGSDFGEIQVKSPGMMKGYFKDEAATISAFTEDGWFKTGDLGYLDKRKNLFIKGRLKENIILATGKKISPNDLEKYFDKVDGISDFIICGVAKNDGAYDEIHGFIVKNKDNSRLDTDIEADISKVNNTLPGFMKVNKFHIINEIPKTAIQKPKRYLLKNMVMSSAATHEYTAPTCEALSIEADSKYFDEVLETASKFNYSGVHISGQTKLFEEIGFDSLTATEFCHRIEVLTGKNIAFTLRHNITVNDIVTALINDLTITKTNDMLSAFPQGRKKSDFIVIKLLKTIFKLAYSIEVKGLSNLPNNGGFLICPNHETHLDAFFILSHLPEGLLARFCCMAKKEHLNNFFGRTMLRIGGGIPVDRYDNATPSFERCLKKLTEGWVILIHPEGTRTSDGNLGEFKKGAAKLALDSGLPIVPVRIKGTFAIYPKGKLLPRLFDFAKFKRFKLSIFIDPPILPDGHDEASLTSALRNRISVL